MRRRSTLLVWWVVFLGVVVMASPGWALEPGMDTSAADATFGSDILGDGTMVSLAVAEDINDDGYSDILIGAHESNTMGGGTTYLIFGKTDGWAHDTHLSNSDASFVGEDANDQAGNSVASAGDVNGDGYSDILIGAPSNDQGGEDSGQTYLILGRPGGWAMDTDLSAADASFIGEAPYDWSGYSVASAGDVNGDGYDDILVGALPAGQGGNYGGQAYLILGKATGWTMDTNLSTADASFVGENNPGNVNLSMSSAGDINGDGYDDILIGASGNFEGGDFAGQTYVILGKASGWAMDTNLSTADASFIGEDANDTSGFWVSSAGDVNADDYDDIYIGAPRFSAPGISHAYLILGKANGWAMDTDLANADASFVGEDANDTVGLAMAPGGDINGDGYDDIVIGVWKGEYDGYRNGVAYVILGKASGWATDTNLGTADASFLYESDKDVVGGAIAANGDVNGDGYGDILTSGVWKDEAEELNGEVILVFSDDFACDLDDSNSVDLVDFGQFSGHWMDGPCDAGNDWCGEADINRLNGVDFKDLVIFAEYWLTGIK